MTSKEDIGVVSHQDASRSGVGLTAMAVCKMRHQETENAGGLIKDPYARALYNDDASVEAILAEMLESQSAMLNGMAVRTKRIDDEMVASLSSGGFAQVVSLGAGLDTRPWRLALTGPDAASRAAAIKYYEVDFSEVFAYKLPRLEAAGAEEQFAYTAVHADLSTPQWLERLLEAGFTLPVPPAAASSVASSHSSAGATLFLLEGLTGYLTEQECTLLMADLTRIAAPGSLLLATFLTLQSPPATHLHRFKPVDPLHYMSRSGHWAGCSTDLTVLAEEHRRPVGKHFVGYSVVDVIRTQLQAPPAVRYPAGLYIQATEQQPSALVITGFGPFADVVNNPTAEIIHALRQAGGGAGGGGAAWLPSFPLKVLAVLEVSVAGVEAFMSQTAALCPRRRVSIHLGVDGGAMRFKLESSCYNNSSFRVPDERGMQPQEEPISASRPLDFRQGTSFDCAGLCAALAKEGFDVEVSDDPGRYLCNYVYYRSCCEQQGRALGAAVGGGGGGDGGDDGGGVIFIHVPPFSVVPAAVQLAFVRRAAELLCARADAPGL